MLLPLITLLFALAGAAAFLREPRPWHRAYLPLALLLLIADILYTGPYYPLFPAYLVIVICAARLPFHIATPRLKEHRRALALAAAAWALTLASLAGCVILPRFTLPQPTGPNAVGTRTLHLTDPATHRELAVQLWYPALPTGPRARYITLVESKPRFLYWHWLRTSARQDAPVLPSPERYPLLLFSPMWNGRRTQDTALAEDLASHGYVVAAADHPGNAARLLLPNGSVRLADAPLALTHLTSVPATRGLWAGELALWTADSSFVLSTLLADPALPLDPTRIGAFGHSFGGAASIALLAPGSPVRAAVNLDGWTFNALDRRTTQPILFVYEASGLPTPTGPSVDDQLDRQDRALIAQSLAAAPATRAYIHATQHADFTDEPFVSPIHRLTATGPIAPARVQQITRTLTLNFFDQTLHHPGPAPTTFPEVNALR